MKLILLILPILVIATLGMTVAETPPENVEPSMKKYLTAEEETARWPNQVARDEMGPLMVQRGLGKVVYSFWNPEVEKRLFDRTFMIAEVYVFRNLYDQEKLDKARELFLRDFKNGTIAWILILAYDDDTVLPIAYRLHRGVYERQPADVAKSLVDQTRAPNGDDLSLRDIADMFDSYESNYFCRFYTREGRYILYYPQSHDTLEASLREHEEFLRREKPYYFLIIDTESLCDCFYLTSGGMYRPFDGPMCEALDIRAARGNSEPPTQAMIDEAMREYEEYERRRQAEQRELHTPTSTTDQRQPHHD